MSLVGDVFFGSNEERLVILYYVSPPRPLPTAFDGGFNWSTQQIR